MCNFIYQTVLQKGMDQMKGLFAMPMKWVFLLITVDTGIAAIHEATVAKELGLDLIITDHHEPGPELPEAFAIVHPKLGDGSYPSPHLAGVGVAFKLAHALLGSS